MTYLNMSLFGANVADTTRSYDTERCNDEGGNVDVAVLLLVVTWLSICVKRKKSCHNFK